MTFENLLLHMDPCPLCLDISYIDAEGIEHLMFDLCEVHRQISAMSEVCDVDTP